MPEGKKNTAPIPAPVRDEDGYSAKTHLHQPVQETATVAATALLADAPEGALPSEVRPEIVTWEKLCEAIPSCGKAYNMEMIQKAYELANNAHNGVCRRSGEPYICHPLAVARLVLDLGMDSESIAAALLHDVVEDTPTTLEDLTAAKKGYAAGDTSTLTVYRQGETITLELTWGAVSADQQSAMQGQTEQDQNTQNGGGYTNPYDLFEYFFG